MTYSVGFDWHGLMAVHMLDVKRFAGYSLMAAQDVVKSDGFTLISPPLLIK